MANTYYTQHLQESTVEETIIGTGGEYVSKYAVFAYKRIPDYLPSGYSQYLKITNYDDIKKYLQLDIDGNPDKIEFKEITGYDNIVYVYLKTNFKENNSASSNNIIIKIKYQAGDLESNVLTLKIIQLQNKAYYTVLGCALKIIAFYRRSWITIYLKNGYYHLDIADDDLPPNENYENIRYLIYRTSENDPNYQFVDIRNVNQNIYQALDINTLI